MSNDQLSTQSDEQFESEENFKKERIVIPVIEEQVNIEKKIIETARVHISKTIHEDVSHYTVPFIEENVTVERIPKNEYVDTIPPAIRYEGDVMIIPVLKEVAVVEKRIMVVEELHVTKSRSQKSETFDVNLRKEEVNVSRKEGDTTTQLLGGNKSITHTLIFLIFIKTTIMAQTVVGLFDTAAEAQQAVQTLTSKGFSREDIDVSTAGSQTSNYSSGTSSGSHDDDRNDSGIVRFFKNLFSDDDDNSEKYARVASRSGSIVTVHAQTSEQAEMAADVLDDSGAVNVDERAATYGYSGTGTSYNPSNEGDLTTSGARTTGDYATSGSDTLRDNLTTGSGSTSDYATSGAGLAAGTTGITNDYSNAGSGVTGNDYSNTGSRLTGDDSSNAGSRLTGDDFSNTGTGRTGDYNSSANLDTTNDSKKIQVIEENLQIGKREVTTGGVRVRSRIIERPVEESLRLREESVRVERTQVDRAATDAELSNFQETNIEMTERSEVPVVSKEARVVEEITIDKDVDERTETISDTVRKTEVDVENIEKSDRSGKYSDS